jgi:serine/threonine-protein kinase
MAEPALGVKIGPFTIAESLPAGHGGMARVFVATVNNREADGESLPERVALKIARVTPADRPGSSSEQAFYFEALNNEVETLKRLRHPNIVRLFPIPRGLPRNPYAARATELDGNPWFCAMEFLGGGSLEDRIRALGALSLNEGMEIAYQIGLAIDHIHAKGLAHLDLKPENVLFRYPVPKDVRNITPRPVLIDFGIAAKMRMVAPPAGSLAFMPPERIRLLRGETAPEQVGDQSKVDVYGLGVILYRMLTGKLPYENLPRNELTSAILSTAPQPPRQLNPDIPPKVEELMMAALEKEPLQRPPIEEVITRLDETMVGRPPAPLRTQPPPPRPQPRRFLIPLTALLAIALTLCSLVSLIEFGLLSTGYLNQPTSAVTVVVTATPLEPTATPSPTTTPTQAPTPTPVSTPTPISEATP